MSERLVVRIRAVVTKLVTVEGCREEDIAEDPASLWEFAVDEQEIDQSDWEILSIEEA